MDLISLRFAQPRSLGYGVFIDSLGYSYFDQLPEKMKWLFRNFISLILYQSP